MLLSDLHQKRFQASPRSFVIFYNWSHFAILVNFIRVMIFSQDCYWVIKNLHIHGNMVLSFGISRCIERNLFFVARICIFFKCVVKSHFVLYFFAQSLTLQHHLELSFTHSTPINHAMGKVHHLHQELGWLGQQHFGQ